MEHSDAPRVSFRIIYGIVIFVICLSALEQFTQLNEDVFNLSKISFHLLTVVGFRGHNTDFFLTRGTSWREVGWPQTRMSCAKIISRMPSASSTVASGSQSRR